MKKNIKLSRKNVCSIFSLLVLIFLISGCDIFAREGNQLSSTTSAVQTIPPATLTAISLDRERAATPIPNPMGIHWSELDGMELDFWYVWDLDEPGAGMNAIVNRFNQENEWGITIKAVDQGLSQNPRLSIETAFQEGVMPNIMLAMDLPIAGWYETGYVVDLNLFLDDPVVGISESEKKNFYRGVFDNYFTRDGSLPGFPFAQTIQVIYYNQSWGREMGYSYPPSNIEDLFQQSCAAAGFSSGDDQETQTYGGLILYPDAANITSWIYAYNGSLLDNNTGNFDFSSQEIRKVGRDWITLQQDGCGYMITGYPNPMAGEIELDHFQKREAMLIMGSSRLFDQIHTEANLTGRPDDWLMIPFVGPEGEKAVVPEIQSIVIFDNSTAEQLGSWLFLKYLINPETQAEWAQYSSYYPVRRDAVKLLRDFRADHPHWDQGLNLLKYARPYPLHPSWEIVQQALGDAFEQILLGEPRDLYGLLLELDQTAAELVLYSRSR